MTKEKLIEYINTGREIEFTFNGKRYSITYGYIDNIEVISFCEFNKKTTEVVSIEKLLQITRNGYTVREMWNSLDDSQISIF